MFQPLHMAICREYVLHTGYKTSSLASGKIYTGLN
jgi:hypothetical protein